MMTPRGRPRDTQVDERVLRIAAALIFEHGYAGLSIDEVAEQAGVAKTTLYRRWPTKDHLAVAVVARLQADHEITETGGIRTDLVDNLDKVATALNRMRAAGGREGPSAGVAGELVAAAARHEDIGKLAREQYAERNALALALIERARVRGELRADVDAEALFDQLAGALYYRVLITGAPVDRAYVERLVSSALEGSLTCR
ncbi:TetR/AcrR family transcriptional regulator [Sphaerisporangium fuscum]|uniref:TetR/AcrR family transcriptional regulator n=1 Tax=Sphaerisporangium fuscum TaxID=2835868 RepID=UPI001BDC440B|nr:TetR/AcrR family transcriptional regulator [Sphaerisporangium fuscum]